MKVEVIRATELSAGLRQRWRRIQEENDELASPFFCHEFISLVASVRNDVYIAVLRDDDCVAGFFPFQRRRGRLGRAVGGILSDHHGIVGPPGLKLDSGWLLRACGLVSWEFDHVVAGQSAFLAHHRYGESSPMMDIRDGYDAYEASRGATGTKLFKTVARRRRKIQREVGTIRYETHVGDVAALTTCLQWKSMQYRNSGIMDLFSFSWPVALLRKLQQVQSEDFAGLFSALWIDDRLIAAHMGMRSRHIWHWWFPSYDLRFQQYSTGLILLLSMAQAAPALGVRAIDLGKGDDDYKRRLSNHSLQVCAGRIEIPCVANKWVSLTEKAQGWIEANPQAPWFARLPGRVARKYRTWASYR